jgi:hypothetical protein
MARFLDSLDRVEFVMELERQFDVDLPDDVVQLGVALTVGDIWRAAFWSQTGGHPPDGEVVPPRDPRWAPFIRLVAKMCDLSPADVHWGTRPFG